MNPTHSFFARKYVTIRRPNCVFESHENGQQKDSAAFMLYCTAKCRIFSSNLRRTHSGKKDKEKEECGLLRAVICPMPPLLSPLPPTPRICRTACSHVIRISWRETPPPSPPLYSRTPHCWNWTIFSDLGQKRGRPPFRGLKVLRLNLDSFCDYVRILSAVIGHLWAEIDFWFFLRKWWTERRYFDKSCRYNSRDRTGDTAHISWAAWVLKSLEDYMNERQHHLNESSSARLGRSQKLEILPSPNSKQTQSLGANFLMTQSFGAYILIGAEISTSALFLSYIMWRSNFTIPHSFAAYILEIRLHLPPTFAAYISVAYICRIHLPPIFWKSAYILSKRQYFMHV